MHGGEIFVPKIPSVNVVDLAKAMAPEMPQKVIGMRAGEKLHEVMISSDDSRSTYDFGGFYVIEPVLQTWERSRPSPESLGGKACEEGFAYASNTNQHWIDDAGIRNLLSAKGLAT